MRVINTRHSQQTTIHQETQPNVLGCHSQLLTFAENWDNNLAAKNIIIVYGFIGLHSAH